LKDRNIPLAKLFHLRKIKSLHIRPGIPPEELTRFASKITLPLKEFIKEGGAQNILRKENILRIEIREFEADRPYPDRRGEKSI